MALTPEREAILRDRLTALEDAEFKLVAGTATASVTYEGESVTFTRAGGVLQIRDMMNRIRRELGEPTETRPRGRRVVFG
jgi:trimethylamine:corrinoid methyltransferase-like protein